MKSQPKPRNADGIRAAEKLFRYDINIAARKLAQTSLKGSLEQITKEAMELAETIGKLDAFLAEPETYNLTD